MSRNVIQLPDKFKALTQLSPFAGVLQYEISLEPDDYPALQSLKLAQEFVEWIAEVGDFKL